MADTLSGKNSINKRLYRRRQSWGEEKYYGVVPDYLKKEGYMTEGLNPKWGSFDFTRLGLRAQADVGRKNVG